MVNGKEEAEEEERDVVPSREPSLANEAVATSPVDASVVSAGACDGGGDVETYV